MFNNKVYHKIDALSGSASAEEVGVAGAVVAVLELISAFEKSFENAHGDHAPFRGLFFQGGCGIISLISQVKLPRFGE